MIPWISVVFVFISLFEFLIFSDLGFFSPHFNQVFQGSVNLVYFFKESVSFILCIFFCFYFIYFCPYFNYLSPSACFGICFFLFL
jgi:hypothetical protein